MQPLSIAGSACGSVDSDVEDDLDPEYLFCEPKELGGVDDDGEYAARLREFREHWRAEAAAAASQVDRGGACGRTSTDVEPRTRADAVVLPGPADEEVTGAGEGPRLIRGRKLIVVEGSNGESSRVEIPISDLGVTAAGESSFFGMAFSERWGSVSVDDDGGDETIRARAPGRSVMHTKVLVKWLERGRAPFELGPEYASAEMLDALLNEADFYLLEGVPDALRDRTVQLPGGIMYRGALAADLLTAEGKGKMQWPSEPASRNGSLPSAWADIEYVGAFCAGVPHGHGVMRSSTRVRAIEGGIKDGDGQQGAAAAAFGVARPVAWELQGNFSHGRPASTVAMLVTLADGGTIKHFSDAWCGPDPGPGTTVVQDLSGRELALYSGARQCMSDCDRTEIVPDGHGTLRLRKEDGRSTLYTGSFRGGKMNGTGKLVHSDQASWYDGTWASGRRSGEGTFRTKDGREFTGKWVEDHLEDGYGILRFPDGAVYEGDFKEMIPHGPGTVHFGEDTPFSLECDFFCGLPRPGGEAWVVEGCGLSHPATISADGFIVYSSGSTSSKLGRWQPVYGSSE